MSAPFVERLLRAVPALRPVHAEHLRANDEILLIVLMAEVGQEAIVASRDPARASFLRELLAFLERELATADDATQAAIHTGFCEHFWGEPEAQAVLLPMTGPRLRAIMNNYSTPRSGAL